MEELNYFNPVVILHSYKSKCRSQGGAKMFIFYVYFWGIKLFFYIDLKKYLPD